MTESDRETMIVYSGGMMDDAQFDELVELYAKYGLTIEYTSDCPHDEEDDD